MSLLYKSNFKAYALFFQCLLLYFMMNMTLYAKENVNSLIHEDSPYLLQHAHNPVNWMAWNQESFAKAKKQNKLIFLSIGYSTCHWCHVMEEESFENEDVAKILNEHFISIKVDREEMPHVDKYYQEVHNLINQRSGGWPLTIVLTPERKAFFAATYLPLDRKFGLKGIKELLASFQEAFVNDKERMYDVANNIEQVLKNRQTIKRGKRDINISVVEDFVKEVDARFDHTYYGIGEKPKFPHASTVQTLLDIYRVYRNDQALLLATQMLQAMAKGGINDQIEGGFYRYSVDEQWQVPHFEKMLYTNAELLSAYANAYSITGDVFYKQIAQETVAFLDERFNVQELFYSASDADSLVKGSNEKEEGAYFVFSSDEVTDFLESKGYSQTQIEEVLNYFNITFEGNFENGLSNPYLTHHSKPHNIEQIKEDLKALRSTRPYPFVDNKILTSWNAMTISALFDMKSVDDKYANKALKHLDSLIKNLYVDGQLYHQKLLGKSLKVKALFEDYAFLIEALLKAYDDSLKPNYLTLAQHLSQEAIKKFYKDNQWVMSEGEFQPMAGIYDSTYKSALPVMIDNLLKVALLNDDLKMQQLAQSSLEAHSYALDTQLSASAWFLRTYMAFKKAYILLKAKHEMLENKALINYPFILKKAVQEEKYLACKIGVCFAFDDEYDAIIKAIEKEIKEP